MKKLLVFYIIYYFTFPLFCQTKNKSDSIQEKIEAYKFFENYTGLYKIKVDSSLQDYQIYNPAFKNYALNQYLGNLGLAFKSSLANEQKQYTDFLFDNYTRYNYHNPEDIKYYKVRAPYTVLTYYTGGPKSRQEQKLNILHTQNVNKNLNVGFLGDLVYSDGEFINQKTSGNYYSLFSSLDGQRYRYNFNINLNSLKANLNGGLLNDSIYENSPNVRTNTIPVSLNNANSKQKNLSIFLQHRFFLTGSYKDDSIKTTSRWNEALSVIHRLQFEKSWRTYSDIISDNLTENSLGSNFYRNTYIDSTNTHDSTYFRRLENTFLLAFNTSSLLKIPAELRIGLKSQIDSWSYIMPLDSMSIILNKYKKLFQIGMEATPHYNKNNSVNTALVGSLTNRFSKTITWGASAELYFTGYKAGNLYLAGDLTKTIKNNFIMTISGDLRIEKPQYFINKFASNNFMWDNNFNSLQSYSVLKARFSHEKFNIAIEGQTGTYINYIFFDSLGLPEIADRAFNVYMVSLKKHFNLRFFQSLFNVTFQRSGNEIAMPLPNIVFYNSSYFTVQLVKNVLRVNFGYDLYYNTRYFAMSYMPSTGIYYSQDKQQIGNYPYADVFLNINLKRARFFIKYENVTSFTSLPASYYIPHYPFAPRIIKYGISWNFYD